MKPYAKWTPLSLVLLAMMGCGSYAEEDGNQQLGEEEAELSQATLSASSNVYEAERSTSSSGCVLFADPSEDGGPPTGGIGLLEQDSWFEWNNIEIGSTGKYTLVFSHDTVVEPKTFTIRVNKRPTKTVEIVPNTTKTRFAMGRKLMNGTHTIRVGSPDGGGPVFDKMTVVKRK